MIPKPKENRWKTHTSLTVTATGAAPLTYQWRKDGVALSGASGATLTLVPTNRAG